MDGPADVCAVAYLAALREMQDAALDWQNRYDKVGVAFELGNDVAEVHRQTVTASGRGHRGTAHRAECNDRAAVSDEAKRVLQPRWETGGVVGKDNKVVACIAHPCKHIRVRSGDDAQLTRSCAGGQKGATGLGRVVGTRLKNREIRVGSAATEPERACTDTATDLEDVPRPTHGRNPGKVATCKR